MLIINNIRDYKADQLSNKKTLIVIFGKTFGKLELLSINLLSYFISNSISKLTNLNKDLINLKGKTVEKLGLIGKEKAIACEVIISITKYD